VQQLIERHTIKQRKKVTECLSLLFHHKASVPEQAAKQDDPRLTDAEEETRGGRRNSLRRNSFLKFKNQPPPNHVVTQDMAISGTNKPTLIQYLVSI
jgi:hypothetical protein